MGVNTPEDAAGKLAAIISEIGLDTPTIKSKDDIDVLKTSVNPVRLINHPIALSEKSIEDLYSDLESNYDSREPSVYRGIFTGTIYLKQTGHVCGKYNNYSGMTAGTAKFHKAGEISMTNKELKFHYRDSFFMHHKGYV